MLLCFLLFSVEGWGEHMLSCVAVHLVVDIVLSIEGSLELLLSWIPVHLVVDVVLSAEGSPLVRGKSEQWFTQDMAINATLTYNSSGRNGSFKLHRYPTPSNDQVLLPLSLHSCGVEIRTVEKVITKFEGLLNGSIKKINNHAIENTTIDYCTFLEVGSRHLFKERHQVQQQQQHWSTSNTNQKSYLTYFPTIRH